MSLLLHKNWSLSRRVFLCMNLLGFKLFLLLSSNFFFFLKKGFTFKEPFWIASNLSFWNIKSSTWNICIILSNFKLLLIHYLIQSMHFSHFFYFIKIYNKATLISMVFFYAFSTEDSQMIWAIKMLYSLLMFLTK